MTRKQTIDIQLFVKLLGAIGIKSPVTEYRFHPRRRWRFDLCWPDEKLALEIEGGVWTNGRHVRGSGFLNDMEKYNEAALMGYTLLRATYDDLASGRALELVEKFFNEEED